MIELVLFVCLANQPAECRQVHLGVVEGFTDQLSCARQGMIEASRWIGEHPNFVFSSLRCGPQGGDT